MTTTSTARSGANLRDDNPLDIIRWLAGEPTRRRIA